MFKKILCPLDGSDHARKAFGIACDLAKAGDGALVLFHSLLVTANSDELQQFAKIEGLDATLEPQIKSLSAIEARIEYEFEEHPISARVLTEIGQKILDDAKMDAKTAGVKDVETVLTGGDTASQILRTIEEKGCDCVVMGSRGLSDVRALFLGSVSHKVTNQAPCTVIAVK
ncbi:MAG: universal stress protein [Alphaproteobacteria bacterium]|nr:universal stress protein [Alphaproteobacteria bacterium]